MFISNSAAPAVLDLYKAGGFHIQTIDAGRNIAASALSRGPVKELLISTYRSAPARALSSSNVGMTGTE